MRLLEHPGDFVVGEVTFPFTNYLFNRKNILSNYRNLMNSERYTDELLRDLQLKRLKAVLNHASLWCPYYKAKFQSIGFEPEDITTLEDIKRIPPLRRQEVIDHHNEMVDTRYRSSIPKAEQSKRGLGEPIWFARFRKDRLIRNSSSGSTGTPTVFYEDGSTTAVSWAHELRLKAWYGLWPGVKEARLARVSTEYLPTSKILWMRKHLWHQLVLPGMNLSDTDYALCLAKIKAFRPKIFFGITSALIGLADYVQQSEEDKLRDDPDLIITWAAPLYSHEKVLLEEVFHCPVTNIYGSREVGHVAALCPRGNLHINQEHYFVEVEKEPRNDSSAAPGEMLVTPLYKSPMPLIRYRMGDIGESASDGCSCGRSLQTLKNILGRSGEVLTTRDGRMIAPNFWCRAFMGDRSSRSVERFQVIHRKDGGFRLRIARRNNFSSETEKELRRYFDKNFPPDVPFEFEYVLKIDPLPSGKYQLVINEAT